MGLQNTQTLLMLWEVMQNDFTRTGIYIPGDLL